MKNGPSKSERSFGGRNRPIQKLTKSLNSNLTIASNRWIESCRLTVSEAESVKPRPPAPEMSVFNSNPITCVTLPVKNKRASSRAKKFLSLTLSPCSWLKLVRMPTPTLHHLSGAHWNVAPPPQPLQRQQGDQMLHGAVACAQICAAGPAGGAQLGSARIESVEIKRIGLETLAVGSVDGIGDATEAAVPSAGLLSGVGPSARATGPTATASTRTGTLPIDFQNPFFIALTMGKLIADTVREIGTPESRASQSTPKLVFDQRFDGNGGRGTDSHGSSERPLSRRRAVRDTRATSGR